MSKYKKIIKREKQKGEYNDENNLGFKTLNSVKKWKLKVK